jgi:hypothetical protein
MPSTQRSRFAADAAAWVMSAVLIVGSDNLWVTRRCPCDPSTQNDAGRTPAPSSHPDIFFRSPPRLTSPIDSSLHRCADSSSTGLDDSRELYTPRSLHSIYISPASAAPAASF